MELDEFEFDEIVLRDIVDTRVTYFDDGVFGQPKLKRDLYHHFGSDTKWARVKEAHKSNRGSNGELMADRLIEVNYVL